MSDLSDDLFVFSVIDKIRDPNSVGTTVGPANFLQRIESKLLGGGGGGDYRFASYRGTQTMPPCSGGITWLVAKQGLKIKTNQVQCIHNLQLYTATYLSEFTYKPLLSNVPSKMIGNCAV